MVAVAAQVVCALSRELAFLLPGTQSQSVVVALALRAIVLSGLPVVALALSGTRLLAAVAADSMTLAEQGQAVDLAAAAALVVAAVLAHLVKAMQAEAEAHLHLEAAAVAARPRSATLMAAVTAATASQVTTATPMQAVVAPVYSLEPLRDQMAVAVHQEMAHRPQTEMRWHRPGRVAVAVQYRQLLAAALGLAA